MRQKIFKINVRHALIQRHIEICAWFEKSGNQTQSQNIRVAMHDNHYLLSCNNKIACMNKNPHFHVRFALLIIQGSKTRLYSAIFNN